MLFFSKHHRYFVVEGPPVDLEALSDVVLKASGEFGLGRMSPQIRFHDRVAHLSVLRVCRESAPDVVSALEAQREIKVLRVCGSMRTSRRFLSRRLADQVKIDQSRQASVERSLARLRRVRN